jgi:hypothetical protein
MQACNCIIHKMEPLAALPQHYRIANDVITYDCLRKPME